MDKPDQDLAVKTEGKVNNLIEMLGNAADEIEIEKLKEGGKEKMHKRIREASSDKRGIDKPESGSHMDSKGLGLVKVGLPPPNLTSLAGQRSNN